jgi:hypothetical protein
MKHCVINIETGLCVNIIELDSAADWVNTDPAVKLAPDHSGHMGWIWNGVDWTRPGITTEQKAANIRELRDQLLRRFCDSMNTMRWNALTDQQQTDWTAYRQSLLDITEQETFPESVVWPVKPE